MLQIPRVALTCAQCGHDTVRDLPVVLRGLGMLRRTNETDEMLMLQLLESARPRMACESCGATGIEVRVVEEAEWDEWPETRVCKGCGTEIPAERLQLFPTSTHCARCQQQHERDDAAGEREFCAKCGAVLKVRATQRSGITRYEQVCDACGHH